jgi:hypothetical protein
MAHLTEHMGGMGVGGVRVGGGCGGRVPGAKNKGPIHHSPHFFETHPNYHGIHGGMVHHTPHFYATHPHYEGMGLVDGGRIKGAKNKAPIHHSNQFYRNHPDYYTYVHKPLKYSPVWEAQHMGGRVRAPRKRTSKRASGGAFNNYSEFVKEHYHPVYNHLVSQGYHGHALTAGVLKEIARMWHGQK